MTKMVPLCRACGQMKQPNDFYRDKKQQRGLSTYCKDCCKLKTRARYAADPERWAKVHRDWVSRNRERNDFIKKRSAYGITETDWKLPLVCTICGATDKLCFDHSHQSGRIRGRLCASCNKGVGFFKDNPTLLYRAGDYVLGFAKPDIFAATYEPVEDEGGADVQA